MKTFLDRTFRLLSHHIWYAMLKNPWRVSHIHRVQKNFMRDMNDNSETRLIVFMVPGVDAVNGGVMAILSHARESRKLREIHGSRVFICTIPNHPPLARYTRFKNDETLLNIDMLLNHFSNYKQLMLHLPEVHVHEFLKWLEKHGKKISGLRINMMLQNIDLCPSLDDISRLKKFASITCTTAHRAYSTYDVEHRLGCPVFHLSVQIDPQKYRRVEYSEKENIIVYSPDFCPEKLKVLAHLRNALPTYEFHEIRGISYEEYLRLIERIKFSISFGEGLDAYYIEPIFSGSIGCAVYNDRFFTSDYRDTDFVYSSWKGFCERFPSDVVQCEEEMIYKEVNTRQFERCAQEYSGEIYREKLRQFYGSIRISQRI